MKESLDGQSWVLFDPARELMILKRDGTPMTFQSREAAENYLNANDGIPGDWFSPAKVIDISAQLSPSKMKN